ncbi:MAG TPA: AAA domain-containing protein [Blastocatellia bacterium]|nr:AAA domain-containing protein [Blastocatellia bacterium]
MPHKGTPPLSQKPERSLSAHRLAEYITRNRCERFLRFELFSSEADRLRRRYEAGYETMSSLLSSEGKSFEREAVERLKSRERVLRMEDRGAEDFISELKSQAAGRTFYDQPWLEGRIGDWPCHGRADLVQVTRAEGDEADVLVIDIKASRRETVGFRLQVAFYARLVEEAAARAGLRLRSIKGAIARRNESIEEEEFKQFDLALYLDEIERLVAASDSDVARVARTALSDISYHLGPHCDGCRYSSICFIDSAEREDLSLVPLMSASEKNALRAEGVRSARELVDLMQYGKGAMGAAAGSEERLRKIGSRWPLASRLPVLAQRARATLSQLDRGIQSRLFLVGVDYGALPDDEKHPGLIKVFIDAQRDHLEDRLYLIASLIAGPQGSVEIVEMTEGPPETEAERHLLVDWIQRALPGIARLSASESAPVHIYLNDRRGQRALLDALARHFDELCAIPAFYDLLTSTPALTQSMVSFIDDEVRARLNIGRVCQNLYQVAGQMDFKWRAGSINFRERFRKDVFDNVHRFERDPVTGLIRRSRSTESEPMWVETTARFGAQIPLEYVYAAWSKSGRLTSIPAEEIEKLRVAFDVSTDDIRAFAIERCRALSHIEQRIKHKNRQLDKRPLRLADLDKVERDPSEIPFYRVLEEFLYLEHHAALQERLLHFALPPDLRAETGRSLTLRCESYEKDQSKQERASFSFANAEGEPITIGDVAALRISEGEWMALNPIADEEGRWLPAWMLMKGRLAVVERVEEERLVLRLLSLNFNDSEFRYRHRLFSPSPGSLYTLDEMADDLNADKFLEACRNAGSNYLYRWLSDPGEGKKARPVRPQRLRLALEMAAACARAQAPHGLTRAQQQVVGETIRERVVVVQGPPGTGKSHTLGFAVIARALALKTGTRPFRVAVAAKTHAATLIALESIARRARELRIHNPSDPRFEPLDHLKVVKITNDPGEVVSDEIISVSPYRGDGESATRQWQRLLSEPMVVIGGTPGGLYQMVKQSARGKKSIDWSQEYFDLVVVDEASQMGIAEAITAAAFLREDGQFIAIGDHRQMPPILAHAWDQDSRRDIERTRPHLSIFEYLRALGFRSVALDESFRIPAEIAGFLERYIYSEDGINFRSNNRRRLEGVEGPDGWLRAAFEPDWPLVIVEHDETGSQRENRFEAGLISEIVRAAAHHPELEGAGGIGVVVPHRAQRTLLRAMLPELAGSIDTVERFQGGERELVIVSATVSDREFARTESDFLLEPRRLTVAVSRPKRKLIVVSSRVVFDLIPGDLDQYERGALWKYLRHECKSKVLWEGEVSGQRVSVRAMV